MLWQQSTAQGLGHSTAQSVANLVGVRVTQQEHRREKAAAVGRKGKASAAEQKKAAGVCWKWSDGTCSRGDQCRRVPAQWGVWAWHEPAFLPQARAARAARCWS